MSVLSNCRVYPAGFCNTLSICNYRRTGAFDPRGTQLWSMSRSMSTVHSLRTGRLTHRGIFLILSSPIQNKFKKVCGLLKRKLVY